LFHLADCVVTQTVTNRNSLCRLAPMLRRNLRIIRNGVDDTRFCPISKLVRKVFGFICMGTVSEVKNPVRVVQALRILRHQTTQPFILEWAGRYQSTSNGEPTQAYMKVRQLIDEYGLQDLISFKGVRNPLLMSITEPILLFMPLYRKAFQMPWSKEWPVVCRSW